MNGSPDSPATATMGLEVRTTKDRYVCLTFADAAVAKEIAAAIRAELKGLQKPAA